MNWRTSAATTWLRTTGRRFGVNRLVARIRPESSYEERFDALFLSHVRLGDCAWDVGANQGIYSERLSRVVGAQGKIFAFEPSAENFEALACRCGTIENLKLLRIALGERNGTAAVVRGADPLGATTRVVDVSPERGPDEHTRCPSSDLVEVLTGDHVVATGIAPSPNVVKIDVEGAEMECINGLGSVLSNDTLRLIGMEIHFGLLERRGLREAPRQIERVLARKGFALTWTDRSHLVAVRNA